MLVDFVSNGFISHQGGGVDERGVMSEEWGLEIL